MSVKEAVETIVAALESDPGYRMSWRANIAMQFVDEMKRNRSDIHGAANQAAENFLNLLCYRAALPSAGKECDCENPEPKEGVALVSEYCPVHNLRPKERFDE